MLLILLASSVTFSLGIIANLANKFLKQITYLYLTIVSSKHVVGNRCSHHRDTNMRCVQGKLIESNPDNLDTAVLKVNLC